jgi:hypothetical protein
MLERSKSTDVVVQGDHNDSDATSEYEFSSSSRRRRRAATQEGRLARCRCRRRPTLSFQRMCTERPLAKKPSSASARTTIRMIQRLETARQSVRR